MAIRPIATPLAGERVLALSPENATDASTFWQRRLNLFAGRALPYPPAAELLSHEQIATILTEELGRPIRFTAVTREEWTAQILELSQREDESVINADMARHIPAIGVAMASARAPIRAPDSAELQRLTGAAPLPLRQFLAEHCSIFGQ